MPSRTADRGIVWVDESLFRSVGAFGPILDEGVGRIFQYEANEAQNMMRTNAPWNDRTGNARQGLFTTTGSAVTGPGRGANGRFTTGVNGHFMVLYHTVPYGLWLEIRNSGQYAIIEPSLQPVGIQVMQSIKDLFNLMDAVA